MGGATAYISAFRPSASAAAPAIANAWKGTTASASSVAITVSPTAGNLCVVGMSNYLPTDDQANHAVTDNIDGATGWVKLGGVDRTGCDGGHHSFWYKKNMPSGVTTITCAAGVTTSFLIGFVQEVSGVSTSAPFTIGEYGTTSTSGATSVDSATITNATAASIFVAYVGQQDLGNNPSTLTPNGSFTYFNSTTCRELNGTTYFVVASMPKFAASTSSATTCNWTALAVACPTTFIAAFHA